MELSDRQRKLLFAGLVAVLAVVGVYLTVAGPESEGDQAAPRGAPTAAPTGPSGPSSPPAGIGSTITPGNFDIYRLLPFSKNEFSSAAGLAQRFVAAYGTYRYDEDPQTYVGRLAPMAADELAAQLARAASTPGLIEQRRADQEVAQSTATVDQVRDIEDNSLVFLVTGNQTLTKSGRADEVKKQWAVTVARDGNALRVYDIQEANVGQLGDTGGAE